VGNAGHLLRSAKRGGSLEVLFDCAELVTRHLPAQWSTLTT